MKIWAVIIGKGLPYIADNKVFDTRNEARCFRNEILEDCGHREVYVKKFILSTTSR